MMQILIVGILPRGAWSLPEPYAWPNRLTEGIALVNNASQVQPAEFLPGCHAASIALALLRPQLQGNLKAYAFSVHQAFQLIIGPWPVVRDTIDF